MHKFNHNGHYDGYVADVVKNKVN